eukprot:scaffold1129_cov164-Ochromonas_danica.AAC.8
MSVRWNELSEGSRHSLEAAIEYRAKDLTGQGLSMTLQNASRHWLRGPKSGIGPRTWINHPAPRVITSKIICTA